MVARYWWRYLLALVVGVAAPAVLFGNSPITFLLAGLTLGVVTRDLSRYRAMAGIWPAIEAVFDWDKIDALLAGRQDP